MMGNQWPRKRWISVAAFGIFCLVFAVVNINEALQVSVLGHADAYPFGGEGPAGDIWYYRSAAKYFWVMAISGVLWALLLISVVYAAIHRSDKAMLRSVGWAMVLFVLDLLTPWIGGFSMH